MEIARRIAAVLRDKGGSSFPLIIAVTLALVMLLAGVSEYFRLQIVAQGVRDAVQAAVVSTVTENYDDVYHGVREGYSGGYQPMADDFEQSLDQSDVYGRLDSILGLNYRDGFHEKRTPANTLEMRVWGLTVDIRNAPIATADNPTARFEADCTIMLEVPVSFGGKLLPPMSIKVKTGAGYTPRF